MTLTLYDFQQEDVDKLQKEPNVLNASEMGYGKTVFAGALDEIRRLEFGGPTLIVAPLSGTINTWRTHYVNQYPDLKGVVLDPKNREQFLDALRYTNYYNYYIIHWDVLARDTPLRKALFAVQWNHIIADEVHRAKNRKAHQTQALKKLSARFKTGLSGTPVTNKPWDYWSILNWLYPKRFGSYWTFYKRYTDFELDYASKGQYHKIKGPKNVEELLSILDPFYVRHLKKAKCCAHHPQGVMPWLPDKTYANPIWVELSPKQRRVYDQMRKDMLAWVGEHEDQPLAAPVAISKLIRLQQIALATPDIEYGPCGGPNVVLSEPSSKIDAVMEILNDNPDQQFVIFSQFSKVINLLGKRLEKARIPASLFTGDVEHARRTKVLEDFQQGRTRVFAGTIKAGGVGLDLQTASTVIFLDRSWSPAENIQAEDRCWRHGQKNAVEIIDIMATNTVDLGRQQIIEQKWEWIRALLGDT